MNGPSKTLRAVRWLLGVPRWIAVILLRGYRAVISPLYGQVCRYHPSCSAYALDAVSHHGVIRGGWLAVRRLVRCHPWAEGGVDYVPGTEPVRPADQQTDTDDHLDLAAVGSHPTNRTGA